MNESKTAEYSDGLPGRMYAFFNKYADVGAPSFDKFARSIGLTLEDVQSFRRHAEFDRAYRECSEIRRDYLTDNALCRRFDPSFVKYLLDREGFAEDEGSDSELTVKLEVV